MFKGIQWFIERIVERMIPVIGTMFSSSAETLQALGQAEQQSRLEDEARKYEADGKTEIANALRQRAARLTSDNPASQSVQIFENVANDEQRLLPPTASSREGETTGLPNLVDQRPKRRRKQSAPSGNEQPEL